MRHTPSVNTYSRHKSGPTIHSSYKKILVSLAAGLVIVGFFQAVIGATPTREPAPRSE